LAEAGAAEVVLATAGAGAFCAACIASSFCCISWICFFIASRSALLTWALASGA
jgi:hypothetical protein